MSSSNCCFLTCLQVSQEAGQVVRYSHLFQNFPQFIVIHTVKGFGIVNKAEIGVFLELSCFFDDPVDVGNLISGSSAFSKTSLNIGSGVEIKSGYCDPVLPPAQPDSYSSSRSVSPVTEALCATRCLSRGTLYPSNCKLFPYTPCSSLISDLGLSWRGVLTEIMTRQILVFLPLG